MAWVTWRQHRSQLIAMLGLLVALAAAAFGTHLPIRAAYHRDALSECLPPAARSGCDIIVRHFQNAFDGWLTAVRGLAVLPALAGPFVGAPPLAPELGQRHTASRGRRESRAAGGYSRSRAARCGDTLAAGALVSALVMWWRNPFNTIDGRIAPSGFDVEGLVVPAYALFALTVGVLAGLAFRRTVAAMTATLIVFAATRLIVLNFLRPHFLTPLHRTVVATDSARQTGDWVLSDTLVDAGGRQITAGREDLAVLHAQQAGIDPHAYLVSLGWKRVISYQPASRFWTFQLIEAGLFVALAAAVVLTTLWLIRRRPS